MAAQAEWIGCGQYHVSPLQKVADLFSVSLIVASFPKNDPKSIDNLNSRQLRKGNSHLPLYVNDEQLYSEIDVVWTRT